MVGGRSFLASVAASALAYAAPCEQATAAENGIGIYLLGFKGPLAGVLPPVQGVYFQNDVYLYQGSGGGEKSFPFGGRLIVDVKANARIEMPTYLVVTPVKILGGDLAFSGTFPIGGPAINAGAALALPRLDAVLSRNLRDSVTTYGDPVLGSQLGWHQGNFHWTVGTLVNVPAGDYREGALANLAFHRWAADLNAAVTWLDPKVGLDLSSAVGVTFNDVNPVTQYRTGTEFHAEWAAVQNLKEGFSAGLVGYYYQQLTGDSGAGAKLGPFKGRVVALGGTAAYTFKVDQRDITARVKVYQEFDVQNRLEGISAFMTVSMPLWVFPTQQQLAAAAAAAKASMPVKAPAAATPAYDWSGFYAGINLGASWARGRTDHFIDGAPIGSTAQNLNGFVGGGQVGFNWQTGKWVFGFEADIQGASRKDDSTITDNVFAALIPIPLATGILNYRETLPWFGTVRGRVGVTPTERVLAYATGGFAYGEVRTDTTFSIRGLAVPDASVANSFRARRTGWTVGGGLEGALINNWTAKLEYLYVDLGRTNETFAGIAPFGVINTSSRVTDSIVRFGLNYRLGASALSAKY